MSPSKRKVALVFGYNGANFFGSQVQSGPFRTVETELEAALHRAGLISDSNHGNLHKISWSRASRTDRGVHAKSTVVGLKVEWPGGDSESVAALINASVPEDLRVFAVKEVTNSFNAHGKAAYREYEYLFPVQSLLPSGTVYSPEFNERVKSLTSKFIGTKNYHNFTRKLAFEKAEARRYIVKFEPAQELVTYQDLQFLRFLVTGQSFLYHQIRSMVGCVLAVLLGKWTPEEIDQAFTEPKKVVPIAPAEGLYLTQVLYTGYNRKQPQKAVQLSPSEEVAVTSFFTSAILPKVAESRSVFESWKPDDPESLQEDSPARDVEDS